MSTLSLISRLWRHVSRVSDLWNARRMNGTAHTLIPAGLPVSLFLFWTFNKKKKTKQTTKNREKDTV